MASESWTVPAQPQEIGRLRQLASRFADANGVPEPPREAMKLAISEAATNVVLHAYQGRDAGTISVALTVTPREGVEVVIRDRGTGMKPRQHSPGGGVGLPLITELADEVVWVVGPEGAGTELRMRFSLAG